MSCSEVDGAPVYRPPEVMVSIQCTKDSSSIINTACLKGTMKGGGDHKFPLNGNRWHDITWMFKITEGHSDTDGDGKERIYLDLNICIRVMDYDKANFKITLEEGVSYYLSQMVNAKEDKYCVTVTGDYFEDPKSPSSD